MNNKWLLKQNVSVLEYTSFPYAFRAMYHAAKKALEKGQHIESTLTIISPLKDVHGDCRRYNYAQACQMATNNGLLSAEGLLNNKEFKR